MLGQLARPGRWLVLPAVVGAVLALALAVLVTAWTGQRNLASAARQALQVQNERTAELRALFNALDQWTGTPCTPEHLTAMRTLFLRIGPVLDIAYHQRGHMRCSTTLGTSIRSLPPIAPGERRLDAQLAIRDGVRPSFAPEVVTSQLSNEHYSVLIEGAKITDGARRALARSVSGGAWIGLSWADASGHPTDVGTEIDAAGVGGTVTHSPASLRASLCAGPDGLCATVVEPPAAWLGRAAAALGAAALAGALAAALLAAGWRARRFRATALDRRLTEALRERAFTLHYQPIADCIDGRVVGAEALIRWTPRDGKPVPPDVFIPVIEAMGRIGEVSCFVVEQVGRELGGFLRDRPGFSISVNVHPADLASQTFHACLRTCLERHGLAPRQLSLELTERQPVTLDAELDGMQRLAARGHQFYLDDFGTGHSNIVRLDAMPVHRVKLDRHFTASVGAAGARNPIVESTLEMIRETGRDVVVEGIETSDQASYFALRGVRLMQGWWIGRPVPAAQFMPLADRPTPVATVPDAATVTAATERSGPKRRSPGQAGRQADERLGVTSGAQLAAQAGAQAGAQTGPQTGAETGAQADARAADGAGCADSAGPGGAIAAGAHAVVGPQT